MRLNATFPRRTDRRTTLAVAAVVWALSTGAAAAQSQGPAPPASASTVTGVDSSRLFLGPTARSLPKGEGYVSFLGLFIPTFQIGVTDRVSVGAGTMYLVEGVFWVTPKVQIARRGSTNVAAGLFHVFSPDDGQLGIAYLGATTDRVRGGWSYGAGVAYSTMDDEDFRAVAPVVLIGGDYRVGRRVVFMSENYVILGGGVFSTNGIRASWQRVALDVGAFLAIAGDSAFGGPWFSVSFPF